ncbi:hypothetical protein NG796_17035 [Laspinema sp. A4]|uniref:hypothetical protein n=1 Tax=Laspinema sp. D2d TaxID=2953686 RepID=UPI0021BACA38|nr:hypothetical protein [Laspinema sp. D2d]MCT7984979.1 hypothetical protein [Laspinema sp. D2d]
MSEVVKTIEQNIKHLPAETRLEWFLQFKEFGNQYPETEDWFTACGKVYVGIFGYPDDYTIYLDCGRYSYLALKQEFEPKT